MKTNRHLRSSFFAALAVAAACTLPVAAHAAVTTSGGASFDSGLPTPRLTITAPISFTVTTNDFNLSYFVLDEWVTSNGSEHQVNVSPSSQTFAYTLNGVAMTTAIGNFSDNLGRTFGSITANDGFFFLSGQPTINVGDKIVIQPATYNFTSNTAFNPNIPTTFTGNAYLAGTDGIAETGLVSVGAVPEPSTWAMMGVGVAGLGVVTLRRRRAVRLA